MFYLYTITNLLNNKIYVGQTVRPKERWSQHKAYAKNNPVQYVHRAIKKYGPENFEFIERENCSDIMCGGDRSGSQRRVSFFCQRTTS